MKIWSCKIGECKELDFSTKSGADAPMRHAIAEAYRKETGKDPDFNFSGWDAELTTAERKALHEPAK